MESLFYAFKPYALIIIGLLCIGSWHNIAVISFGAILLGTGIIINKLRKNYAHY